MELGAWRGDGNSGHGCWRRAPAAHCSLGVEAKAGSGSEERPAATVPRSGSDGDPTARSRVWRAGEGSGAREGGMPSPSPCEIYRGSARVCRAELRSELDGKSVGGHFRRCLVLFSESRRDTEFVRDALVPGDHASESNLYLISLAPAKTLTQALPVFHQDKQPRLFSLWIRLIREAD